MHPVGVAASGDGGDLHLDGQRRGRQLDDRWQLGQLRRELDAAQKQSQAQQESSEAEQSRLQARTQELQTAQAEVEQQVKRLTESLAQETKRRQSAEQQAVELGQLRSDLDAKLAVLGNTFAGNAAIWVENLTDGSYGAWNEDARFPAASTVRASSR